MRLGQMRQLCRRSHHVYSIYSCSFRQRPEVNKKTLLLSIAIMKIQLLSPTSFQMITYSTKQRIILHVVLMSKNSDPFTKQNGVNLGFHYNYLTLLYLKESKGESLVCVLPLQVPSMFMPFIFLLLTFSPCLSLQNNRQSAMISCIMANAPRLTAFPFPTRSCNFNRACFCFAIHFPFLQLQNVLNYRPPSDRS